MRVIERHDRGPNCSAANRCLTGPSGNRKTLPREEQALKTGAVWTVPMHEPWPNRTEPGLPCPCCVECDLTLKVEITLCHQMLKGLMCVIVLGCCISIVGPAPPQKCVGDFCCVNFGGFRRGFSWRIFLGTLSHKNEEKNPARKSAKKSGGPKIKISEKSFPPKTDPNNWKSRIGGVESRRGGDSPQ